jgi:hypothetical protein
MKNLRAGFIETGRVVGVLFVCDSMTHGESRESGRMVVEFETDAPMAFLDVFPGDFFS